MGSTDLSLHCHLVFGTKNRQRSIIALMVVLCGALSFAAQAEEKPQTSSAKMPLAYKGKTASQWIKQLGDARDPRNRAVAAEALGYLARGTRWTYGGFSDVPIDSPEPPQLTEESLRPIVAALVAGLKDPDKQVRASSAIAVSWVGARAKAAVPVLISLLKDRDETVRKNAISAIGCMGPSAKEAIRYLEHMLANEADQRQVDVAEALRLIEAA